MENHFISPKEFLEIFVKGDKEKAERVLGQLASVETTCLLKNEEYSAKLLHWAAYWKLPGIVNKLIELCQSKGNVNITLLLACFCNRDFQVVHSILGKPKNTFMHGDENGWTLLHSACAKGHLNFVKYLIIECKFDPMCKANDRSTPLHSACGNSGNLDVVRYLTEECKCDAMCKKCDGWTALHEACAEGHVDIVKYLVTCCKCDPLTETSDGSTPLYLACGNSGSLDVVCYLVEQCKCNPLCKNNDEWTVLHNACAGGHLEVAKYLVMHCNCNPHCKDDDDWTPLHSVCWNSGNINVVRYLIEECKCDPMCRSNDGWTPLHSACVRGFFNVVDCLIRWYKCDPMCRDIDGWTPLHEACAEGHVDIAKYLITKCKCDPRCKENNGWTPLHSVCGNSGNLDVVRYLIECCKCDPMSRNTSGWIPLHSVCSSSGKLDVVRYLIEKCKCDPMCESIDGWTPLHEACANGHVDVVKYMVTKHMCDSKCKDKCGYTPLYLICQKSDNLDLIRYLIEKYECDPMCQTNDGRIPLHSACAGGHLNTAKYLIENYKCDPTFRSNDGWTPLHSVCHNSGNLGLVKYLIEECKIDPMCRNNKGWTPLYSACAGGNVHVVDYLIKQCKCDPMDTENDGWTPLHSACRNSGNLDVVRFLIKECNCEAMCRNNSGRTPLHSACVGGHINLAKYLITEYKCDPMCKDTDGQTPLHSVCRSSGNLDVVRYLIEECECDPMCETNNGRTPLHSACVGGHVDAVKYLITQCECDPMCKDNEGQTPLHVICATTGSLNVLLYLIESCECNSMCENSCGWTPLHEACAKGHFDVVKCLIAQWECNPFCKGNDGSTPLHSVCGKSGNFDILRYLIEECGCDPMHEMKNGWTPLHLACYRGHVSVVEYLITQCKCDPMCKSIDGWTPLRSACVAGNANVTKYLAEYLLCTYDFKSASRKVLSQYYGEDTAKKALIKKFSQIRLCVSIDSYANIFLLGDSGVGKTTLAEVVKQRTNGNVMFGKYRRASSVELYTAGIVPHKLEHKELGNIILHDLAGQPEYYSSHSAVLENITQRSPAVFIVLVKLFEDAPYRWLSIVKDLSNRCSSVCYVLTVASHADAVETKVKKQQLAQELKGKIETYLRGEDRVQSMGFVYLDCRRLDSSNFENFKTSLAIACQSVKNNICLKNVQSQDVMYCRMLYLLMETKGENIYAFDTLWRMVQVSDNYYLPETKDKLSESLCYLHCTGLIMYINTSGGSWIVLKKQILLAEVDGKIFAPKTFSGFKNLSSNTGIVSEKSIFQLFKEYDHEMLIEFLLSMELCDRITPEMMKMTNLSPKDSDSTEGNLLFFPALMSYHKQPVMSSKISSIEPLEDNAIVIDEPFQFGWSLQCSGEHTFFSPRFLHLLILHLAYHHALPKSLHKPHDRKCTIWSTGILWNNEYGVRTLVELVNSQSVLLLMSSMEGLEQNMISLRKSVISEILSLKEEICSSVQADEYIIDPSKLDYPIDRPSHLVLYDIAGIASCVALNQPCVVSCNVNNQNQYSNIRLSNLFPMEYSAGPNMSIFVGRDIEALKTPGGQKLSNSVFSSPAEVLKKHSAAINESISDPERLANNLHSAGLISFSIKDQIVTITGVSRSNKTSIVMNELERQMRGANVRGKFKEMCEVMKRVCNETVKEIVMQMEEETGISGN